MKPLAVLLLIVTIIAALPAAIAGDPRVEACHALWSIQLSKTDFRDFGIAKHGGNGIAPFWMNDQGLAFISSSLLAVYQVEEASTPGEVQHRNASDGGGRYTLLANFFETRDGKEVGTLRWSTNGAGNSRLYSTHDGRFLVVAGNTLSLYSSKLTEIKSISLPIHSMDRNVFLRFRILNAGRNVSFTVLEDNGPNTASQHLNYVFNSDTLQPAEAPSISELGWQEVGFFPHQTSCPWGFAHLESEYYAGYGCSELKLFSSDGKPLWNVPVRDQVTGVVGRKNLIVAGLSHHQANPFDRNLAPKPLGIAVFDVNAKAELCDVHALDLSSTKTWLIPLFNVSEAGDLAVIQGNQLSLYKP